MHSINLLLEVIFKFLARTIDLTRSKSILPTLVLDSEGLRVISLQSYLPITMYDCLYFGLILFWAYICHYYWFEW